MLAVKGRCHLCKGQVSIMNPAIVCFECEKFHHGQCVDPPKTIQEMEEYVRTKVQWYCSDCSRDGSARIDERTKEDKKDVEDRLNLIIELREVLIKIEEALAQMKQNGDELTEHTKALKEKNDIMRERIKLHEQLGHVVPKNVEDFVEKRKERKIDRQDFTPKKDPLLRFHKKDDFKKYLKKHAVFGNLKERRNQEKQKKKEVAEKKGEHKKKERAIGFSHLLFREGFLYGFYRALKELSSNWKLQFVLLIILIAYTLLGGLLFYLVEGAHEKIYLDRITDKREEVEKELEEIRLLSSMVNFDEPTMYNVTNALFSEHYDLIRTQFDEYGKNLLAFGFRSSWDYSSSVYFCAITITTIGYGDMTPVSNTGKILTMVYALFGIPLYFAMLTTTAKTWVVCLKVLMRFCACRCKKIHKELSDENARRQSLAAYIGIRREYDQIPVWLVVMIMILYNLMGTLVYFYLEEDWGFLNSYYFVFTSVTTIGFGDFVPNSSWSVVFSTIYLLLGLTIAAVTIHVIMERLEITLESAHKKLETYSERYVEKKNAERSLTVD